MITFTKKYSPVWNTTTWISNEPFAVIRKDGTIYLSGDYTVEQMSEIVAAHRSIQESNKSND